MELLHLQIGFIIERCKRIGIFISIIAPIVKLLLKTLTALIGDIAFLLCTLLIRVAIVLFLYNLLFLL